VLFLIDANLPPALALALIEVGHDARHVDEAGLRTADDDTIWDYALQQKAVVITKDEDFPDRYLRSSITPVVVWLRIGNCRNAELLAWFMPLLPQLIARIEFGDRLIEVK
jgi:predicted nuclease of predicted toxin-antitoxin system